MFRTTTRVDEKEYLAQRVELLKEGITFSEWVREKIREKLNELNERKVKSS